MPKVVAWVRDNAAWIQSVLQAGLGLGMAFDLHLTNVQMAAILMFSGVTLGLGAHWASNAKADDAASTAADAATAVAEGHG